MRVSHTTHAGFFTSCSAAHIAHHPPHVVPPPPPSFSARSVLNKLCDKIMSEYWCFERILNDGEEDNLKKLMGMNPLLWNEHQSDRRRTDFIPPPAASRTAYHYLPGCCPHPPPPDRHSPWASHHHSHLSVWRSGGEITLQLCLLPALLHTPSGFFPTSPHEKLFFLALSIARAFSIIIIGTLPSSGRAMASSGETNEQSLSVCSFERFRRAAHSAYRDNHAPLPPCQNYSARQHSIPMSDKRGRSVYLPVVAMSCGNKKNIDGWVLAAWLGPR